MVPRQRDLIDRIISLEKRMKRAENANPPKATENFIVDPVTVRALPPAPAPPRGQIIGVKARLGGGGPIDLDLNVRQADGTIITLHTFAGMTGSGAWYYHNFVDETDRYDLEELDAFYPEVTDGSGANLTASFVIGP